MEHRLRGRLILDDRRITRPADLDAAEQVGFGARHTHDAGRFERSSLAEYLLIRMKTHPGAAPVHDRTELFKLGLRRAAREHHAIELLPARHLDLEMIGQGVDDGYTDAMQTA